MTGFFSGDFLNKGKINHHVVFARNINLPPEKKLVRCQWIFMIEYMVNDIVEHFKTRLMVKSYTQTYRINYIKIFTHVVKINIV